MGLPRFCGIRSRMAVLSYTPLFFSLYITSGVSVKTGAGTMTSAGGAPAGHAGEISQHRAGRYRMRGMDGADYTPSPKTGNKKRTDRAWSIP